MKLFFIQWRSELHKLLARKRTYLGFGAFVLLEIVIYILVTVQGQGFLRRMIQNEPKSAQGNLTLINAGISRSCSM